MRALLLAVALVVSLWPAAVIAFGVERVVGGEEETTAAAPATTATVAAAPAPATTTPPEPAPPPAEPAESSSPPADDGEGSASAAPDLDGLNQLRDDTADLVVALDESSAVAAGQPDPEISAQALDVEAEIVAWQEANEGSSADAEYFAALFADIAAAAADHATAPSAGGARRLEKAVEAHRRETLQGGA